MTPNPRQNLKGLWKCNKCLHHLPRKAFTPTDHTQPAATYCRKCRAVYGKSRYSPSKRVTGETYVNSEYLEALESMQNYAAQKPEGRNFTACMTQAIREYLETHK